MSLFTAETLRRRENPTIVMMPFPASLLFNSHYRDWCYLWIEFY